MTLHRTSTRDAIKPAAAGGAAARRNPPAGRPFLVPRDQRVRCQRLEPRQRVTPAQEQVDEGEQPGASLHVLVGLRHVLD
jgi:hypothetical protein